jgi:predicted pyridoxine 5'-phosphate oxidase superfamily flavin-nucleotide-binding protein
LDDALAEGLTLGAQLGFLGIELHTRRRNRVNGHVVAADAVGFSVEVDQSVGNCPQYIQGREFTWVRDAADLRPRANEALSVLDGFPYPYRLKQRFPKQIGLLFEYQ